MAYDGTYYKVFEFKKLFFQYDSAGAIAETEFPWPNALKPATETQDYTWQGGGSRKKVTSLIAVNYTLDLDALPLSAHKTVFAKSEITDAGVADSYFDISTLTGFGGGNDVSGVTRGVRATANAYAGDTDVAVEITLWIPVATITLAQIAGFSSGNIADKTQYNISATKTAVDITGAAIAGASSGGEFFWIGETT